MSLWKWDKCLSNLAIALNKYSKEIYFLFFFLVRNVVLDYFSIMFSLEIDPLFVSFPLCRQTGHKTEVENLPFFCWKFSLFFYFKKIKFKIAFETVSEFKSLSLPITGTSAVFNSISHLFCFSRSIVDCLDTVECVEFW